MDSIEKLYRVRFSDKDRQRKDLIWKVLCEDFFQHYIPKTACVLDIACGYGEFSRYIQADKKIAIDLNPDSKELLPSDVEFHLTSASDLSMLQDETVDICFSSNFFEHLPSKEVMDEVLAEALRVLKPGGLYISMQPNLRYEPGRYWDYYDHLLPLTHLSCYEAFSKAGFDVIELIGRFIPFSTDSKLPQHPLLVKIYLRFKLLWKVFGGQFVIIGKKHTNGPN